MAWVIAVSRRAIVRMLDAGELPDASRDRWRRIAVEDAEVLVKRWISEDRCTPLAQLLLGHLATGRLRLSRAEAEWLTHEAALARCSLEGRGS